MCLRLDAMSKKMAAEVVGRSWRPAAEGTASSRHSRS
jgi:hypothetical protein